MLWLLLSVITARKKKRLKIFSCSGVSAAFIPRQSPWGQWFSRHVLPIGFSISPLHIVSPFHGHIFHAHSWAPHFKPPGLLQSLFCNLVIMILFSLGKLSTWSQGKSSLPSLSPQPAPAAPELCWSPNPTTLKRLCTCQDLPLPTLMQIPKHFGIGCRERREDGEMTIKELLAANSQPPQGRWYLSPERDLLL